MAGDGGHYLSMHVSQIESNHIGSCWIYVLFGVFFLICLFGFLFLATVCRENIISTNFKRHWLMQHANGLTAATFFHISFPLVWFVCLCRVAGTCPSLPAQNYFCISEREKNKEEEKTAADRQLFALSHPPSFLCLCPYFQHMHILFDMHHVRENPYACEERERDRNCFTWAGNVP